jgi:hypothetical protein
MDSYSNDPSLATWLVWCITPIIVHVVSSTKSFCHHSVEACYKLSSPIPHQEAGFVKCRIGKLPQRICLVGNEMTRANDLVAPLNYLMAERAFGFALKYKCHMRENRSNV